MQPLLHEQCGTSRVLCLSSVSCCGTLLYAVLVARQYSNNQTDQRDENEGFQEGGIGEGWCKETIHCLSLPKKHVGSQCHCSCITELYEK